MNQKEKQLLKILQSEFPLTQRPYQSVARKLKITENLLIEKIKDLKSKGTIRRIGATINPKQIGYKSMLIAVCVEEEKIDAIAKFINSSARVSHNYLRGTEYNIWFTFSAKTKKEINEFISKLKKKKGVRKILPLPSEKEIKIKAEFLL